jgi:hypothetical protein
MQTLTSVERIQNILKRQPVDRIGVFEHFWGDTYRSWLEEGYIREGENLADHFGYDLELCWPFNMVADLDFVPEVVRRPRRPFLCATATARCCADTSCTIPPRNMWTFW